MPLDLTPFSAVLLDLDGTVYHEEHALPGAIDLIRRLQRDGRPFACLTNSTSSPSRIAARLSRMGVTLPLEAIYTAGAAAADFVLSRWHNAKPRVFNLGTEGLHDLLDGSVTWVNSTADACDAVVVGTPTSLYATEDRQRLALDLLRRHRSSILLLGMCADRVYPSPRGIEFGSGALTHMLAYAADVAPVFTGKPERVFFEELCRRLGVPPSLCLLIGDNLESDIAGARNVAMTTALTLTGVTRPEDLPRSPVQPDHVLRDLTEL